MVRMDTLTQPAPWIRRHFTAVAETSARQNLTSDTGVVHALGTSELWGVRITVARCGSSPASGPYSMRPTTDRVTCTRVACAKTAAFDGYTQPTLF